jgi:hypothetical protein
MFWVPDGVVYLAGFKVTVVVMPLFDEVVVAFVAVRVPPVELVFKEAVLFAPLSPVVPIVDPMLFVFADMVLVPPDIVLVPPDIVLVPTDMVLVPTDMVLVLSDIMLLVLADEIWLLDVVWVPVKVDFVVVGFVVNEAWFGADVVPVPPATDAM